MIDPIAISMFSLEIRWYGIYYALAFLCSYYFIMYFSKDFKLRKEFVEDVFLYMMIFSVLGGRIFFILFYELHYYLINPSQIFAVWQGGMSIHGGIFFGFLTLVYHARKEKINFFRLTDLFVIPLALALAFGRLINYVNQELVGKITTSNFGIVFPLYDNEKRIPYQLFAGLKNLFVFQVLLYLQFFKKYNPGQISGWFLILYSSGRFLLDFLRVPTVDLGIISMGQLLNLIYLLAGMFILYYINKK
jgi:phosphatidylglycerol:prolipoprotein diacylglycerol transferase